MAGDATKAGRWATCDVYRGALGVTPPTSPKVAPSTSDYDLVGYLDASAGLIKSLDEDSTVLSAWGGATIENVFKFNGESFKFTAIEDSNIVFDIVYQGSATPTQAAGTTTRTAKIPNHKPSAWLIRLTRTSGIVKDYQIAKGTGALSSDVTEDESDLGGSEITVTVLSNSDRELHKELVYDPEASSAS